MSPGRPNIEQIARLREVLRTVTKEQDEVTQARSQLQHIELKISCGEQRLAKAEREAAELLKAMDCAPNGNYGCEQRMLALLSTLVVMPERVR